MIEQEMRETKVETPKTVEELSTYIESLVKQPHDYGTCVYAMSMAAVAAYNYVASELGVTGFQASCADLDILRRTRRIEGPFMLLKLEDALYPQYDLRAKLEEFLTSDNSKKYLAEHASKKLEKLDADSMVHPDVLAHWKGLVSANTP